MINAKVARTRLFVGILVALSIGCTLFYARIVRETSVNCDDSNKQTSFESLEREVALKLQSEPDKAFFAVFEINQKYPMKNDYDRNITAITTWLGLDRVKKVHSMSSLGLLMESMAWDKKAIRKSIRLLSKRDEKTTQAALLFLAYFAGQDLSAFDSIFSRDRAITKPNLIKSIPHLSTRDKLPVDLENDPELKDIFVADQMAFEMAKGILIPAESGRVILATEELWTAFVRSALQQPRSQQETLLNWLAETGVLHSDPEANRRILTPIAKSGDNDARNLLDDLAERGAQKSRESADRKVQ